MSATPAPASTRSLVLQVPPLAGPAATTHFEDALHRYTDAADLYEDLRNGVPGIVVIDARSPDAFARAHIPGAINFPHRTMNAQSVATLPRGACVVTYCDGIGCNGSTKAAFNLSRLGFAVKELIGGLDWWIRDGLPVDSSATGAESSVPAAGPRCAC